MWKAATFYLRNTPPKFVGTVILTVDQKYIES